MPRRALNKRGDKAKRVRVRSGHANLGKLVFYCGKKGDYRCNWCDGRCGPENGCQCSACAELTLLNKTKIQNASGNTTRVSFDNHHSQSHRHYCGQVADYSCEECDGMCGPTNGCQCSECAMMDASLREVRLTPIALNRNGATAREAFVSSGHIHQGQKVFYCGRRADYDCPSCDGRCGPTDGCQCSACAELTSLNQVRVKNVRGDATALSFDVYHTKTFRYYCGKQGDYTCKKCDGRCGPSDGCTCSACAALAVDMGLTCPPLLNRNGVKSKKTPVSAGHIHKGKEVFYCGQKADYSCTRCDGFCGPCDGCQCSACVELTEANRKVKLNDLGQPTFVSFDTLHKKQFVRYCGGPGQYDCKQCDGLCGPTSGCHCPSCAQLDGLPVQEVVGHTEREVKQESPIDSIVDDGVDDSDDEDVCIICFVEPKTAVLIHGNTGHQLCCMDCATLLQKTGKPCPICSTTIDHVIRLYKV